MQLIACEVALGGNDETIVDRADRPVTFPELLILSALHGQDSLRNVRVIGDVETTSAEERARLIAVYGTEHVAKLFPMAFQDLPEGDPRLKREPLPAPSATQAEPDPLPAATLPPALKPAE